MKNSTAPVRKYESVASISYEKSHTTVIIRLISRLCNNAILYFHQSSSTASEFFY